MHDALDLPVLIGRLIHQIEVRTPDLAADIYRESTQAYSSPARFKAERSHLFLRAPVFAGWSAEIPKPGDYKTLEIAGASLLLVRDQAGELGAFRNACRHRSMRLVGTESGSAKRFVCPFHGWSYDISGRLAAVVSPAAFPGITKETNSLVPVKVQEKHGMIFVRIEGDDPVDIDAHLSGLAPELAGFGWDKWQALPKRKAKLDVNWKLIMDGFGEGYHFGMVHAKTLGSVVIPNTHVVDRFGPHIRELFANHGLHDLAAQPEGKRREPVMGPDYALIYLIYPNLVLTGLRPGGWQAISIWPGDEVGKTEMFECALISPELDAAERTAVERNQEFTWKDIIQAEDWPLALAMWQEILAGSVPELVFGRNEIPLHHLHRHYDLALQGAGGDLQ